MQTFEKGNPNKKNNLQIIFQRLRFDKSCNFPRPINFLINLLIDLDQTDNNPRIMHFTASNPPQFSQYFYSASSNDELVTLKKIYGIYKIQRTLVNLLKCYIFSIFLPPMVLLHEEAQLLPIQQSFELTYFSPPSSPTKDSHHISKLAIKTFNSKSGYNSSHTTALFVKTKKSVSFP